MICSTWRFTLGGVVILDFGDSMLREPEFPLTARVQETGFVGADWAKVFPQKNKIRNYSWSRVIECESIAECQTRALQDPAGLLSISGTTLTIEVEGGGSNTVENFALLTVRPSRRSDLKPTELLLECEGLGGKETVVSNGGF